ncbi:MAG: AAA family ATPase [Thermoprotei archaeon]
MTIFTGNTVIDKLIDQETAVLVFGEAGSGKTTLLLTIASNICSPDNPCIYISTEDTLHYERVARDPEKFGGIFFTEIRGLEELIVFSLKILLLPPVRALFVDSINAPYRLVAYKEDSLAKLGLVIGLLWSKARSSGGKLFASAQVRAGYREDEEEVTASGMSVLEYWFNTILQLIRVNGERAVKAVKPDKGIIAKYTITSGGIRWIG